MLVVLMREVCLDNNAFLDLFELDPIIAILRGQDPDTTVSLVHYLMEIGCQNIELTVEDSSGVESLRRVRDLDTAATACIGAGSVTSVELAKKVIDLGTQFLVCPGVSPNVIEVARAHSIPVLPGVATATDVLHASELDISVVKLFPAAFLGGPAYLRAISAPFPSMRFVPTGGVGTNDASDYLRAGAVAVGIGSELTRPGGVRALEAWLKDFLNR